MKLRNVGSKYGYYIEHENYLLERLLMRGSK
jgi:hypothetical protein